MEALVEARHAELTDSKSGKLLGYLKKLGELGEQANKRPREAAQHAGESLVQATLACSRMVMHGAARQPVAVTLVAAPVIGHCMLPNLLDVWGSQVTNTM
jgi:hypothetical protein